MKLWALSLAAVLAAAAPAVAGDDRPLVLHDVTGDANGINDGGEFHTGDRPTPGSQPAFDLRSVELAPIVEGARTTGLTVTYRMQAPLTDRLQLNLKVRTPSCPDIYLQYVHGSQPRAQLSTGCSYSVHSIAAKASGDTVTLTVPFSKLPGKALHDNVFTTVNAFSQLHVASAASRMVGIKMFDTTLDRATYQLVR